MEHYTPSNDGSACDGKFTRIGLTIKIVVHSSVADLGVTRDTPVHFSNFMQHLAKIMPNSRLVPLLGLASSLGNPGFATELRVCDISVVGR